MWIGTIFINERLMTAECVGCTYHFMTLGIIFMRNVFINIYSRTKKLLALLIVKITIGYSIIYWAFLLFWLYWENGFVILPVHVFFQIFQCFWHIILKFRSRALPNIFIRFMIRHYIIIKIECVHIFIKLNYKNMHMCSEFACRGMQSVI